MVSQFEFSLTKKKRGFHLITEEVIAHLPPLPKCGILQLFLKHTSAALTLNENYDPEVRVDLEQIYDHLIREDEHYYSHTYEGPDDITAHAKSSITGAGLCIPITNGRFNLGQWQGIYLCEFRYNASPREIVATIIGCN